MDEKRTDSEDVKNQQNENSLLTDEQAEQTAGGLVSSITGPLAKTTKSRQYYLPRIV